MNKLNFRCSLALLMVIVLSQVTSAQKAGWMKQIITVNSGKFEYVPPMQDYVTLQSFNPVTKTVIAFDTIFTQSAQDILIRGHFAFVLAQDSIIKYDLNSYKRVAAVADSGLSKLGLYKNRLIVSKQYPLVRYFMEVLDTANLSLIAQVDNIPGDCGGVAVTDDSVYVAVNGGWMGTEGKIAVVDPASWTLARIINLGASAIGINNLYQDENKIYSVNKTPYGMPDVGSITEYDPATGNFVNGMVNVKVGNGVGIWKRMLYAVFNYGIGSFDLNSMKVADSTIIQDPGSAGFVYILSAVIDTMNKQIHVNIGDYLSPGRCLVASLTGDSITTYSTGISTETVGVDYREYPASIPPEQNGISKLSIYPNPAADKITLDYTGEPGIADVFITDVFGREVQHRIFTLDKSGTMTISLEKLSPGMYCAVIKTATGEKVAKFMKR